MCDTKLPGPQHIPVIRKEIFFAPGIGTPDFAVLQNREGCRVLVGLPDPLVAVGWRCFPVVALVLELLSRAALSPEFCETSVNSVARPDAAPTSLLRKTLYSDAGPRA